MTMILPHQGQDELAVSPRLTMLLTQMADTLDMETALRKVLADYLHLKTAALQTQTHRFEDKWGMSFTQFAQACEAGTLAADPYSYVVERDYWEWEEAQTLLDHYTSLRQQWI